jgi:hypothetical protein
MKAESVSAIGEIVRALDDAEMATTPGRELR